MRVLSSKSARREQETKQEEDGGAGVICELAGLHVPLESNDLPQHDRASVPPRSDVRAAK